jgi:hypothetical protein
MKKMYVFVIMVIAGFSAGAQQAQLPTIEITADSVPDWLLYDLPSDDKFWGIGRGRLSTENASCEQAKFNAQVETCKQISYYRQERTNPNNLSPVEQELEDALAIMASEQTSFELSEFITVERRTKTKDGTIWYLVSIQKDIANNFEKMVGEYIGEYVESYMDRGNHLKKSLEEIQKSVDDDVREAFKFLDGVLELNESGE